MRRLLAVVMVAGLVASVGAAASAQKALPRCEAGDPYPVGPERLQGEWILLHYADWNADPRVLELALGRSDGSEIINLTHDFGAEASEGTWSPDGSQIAYVSDEIGTSNIWIMDVTGENRRQLTSAGGRRPAWSPDGTTIAFAGGDRELWFVDVRGCDERLVLESDGLIRAVAWSPDGSAIALVIKPGEAESQIYSLSIPGFEVTQLTDEEGAAIEPGWSPDGTRIAFRAFGRESPIWVMQADGSGQEPLYDAGANDFHPTWSPDGAQVAVYRVVSGVPAVTLVGLNDGAATDIIGSPEDGPRYTDPVWSPGDPLAAVIPVPAFEDGKPPATVTTVATSSTVSLGSTVTPATTVAAPGAAAPAGETTGGMPAAVWILGGVLVLGTAFFAGSAVQARRDPPPPPAPPPV